VTDAQRFAAVKECPRFDTCAAPRCPLDPMGRRCVELPGADQCGARRFDREAIALRHPGLLPDGGLTTDEIGREARGSKGRERWAAMTAQEQAAQRARLTQNKGIVNAGI
jgi:hypothetical protein